MFYEVAISSQPWPGVDAIKAGQASMPVWETAQPCTPVQFSFVHGYFFKKHRLVWTQRLSPRPPQAPEWWDFSKFPGCISFPLLSVSWTCLLSSLNLCCSLSCPLFPCSFNALTQTEPCSAFLLPSLVPATSLYANCPCSFIPQMLLESRKLLSVVGQCVFS